MSQPQNITQKTERRRSIALLTRSPISRSPNPSPRGSLPNSYAPNTLFLRGDPPTTQNPHDESALMETYSDESSSEHTPRRLNSSIAGSGSGGAADHIDLAAGIDNPELIRKISKHLPSDFDSLNQEGADITRDLYKIKEDAQKPKLQRTRSCESVGGSSVRSHASSFNVPGGFRREFLLSQGHNPSVEALRTTTPNFLTRNFIEFLSIYGHFAGEDLEDDDNIANHYKYLQPRGEEEPLIQRDNFNPKGTATDKKAYFLLLKAFVGTGVLFLPKAFANGGLAFSVGLLAFFALLSWWCYTILVYTKMATRVSSFAEIGMKLYGPWLQRLILTSIVVSQIGFVAAYIVFTLENLRAFVSNITGWKAAEINILWFIVLQVLIVIPLSLIRDITKLSLLAVLANVFIFTGLVTILYFMVYQWLGVDHGKFGPGIVYYFNKSEFSLFIGTAIFAFEGIGLIIPIQESMIHPNNFPKVLGQVIFSITVIMVVVGGLGYLTFGENVNTVILLNLPQDSPMVIITQLLYSLAILLSTPLQLFPAIRLLESKLIFGSGKISPSVKWLKNLFRTAFVVFTAYIAFIGGQNLDKFVSFVGCFACIPLVYMYPPILHLKSCCKIHDGLLETEKRQRYWLSILDYVLLVIGAFAFVYTTYQILFT
ncbi:Vacuolar amino acid transporter 4 [Candida viswanathii]|uniref:Vacuolar amino acid transporter 4 n=1 Tax=Candida viswanathii TaxID=5486 RepID=A0A367YDL1_9ASCO|nr:Vacuolar amino acid transporter 4 [Candida viswanathii]